MSAKQDALAADCRRTAEAAAGAVAWFADNTATVRQESTQLIREFRRYNATARRLLAAVERPMCVGVFGPSQSGKSYLISALARKGTSPLIADFDGFANGIDFVSQINPEGGKESTGLVTRFSIRRQQTPPGFPVALRLLSQTDIVKILGNAYLSDCDQSEEEAPGAGKIAELLKAARAAQSAHAVDTLTEDDVYDLQEYFEQRFKGEALIKALQVNDFWAQAAELAPRLAPAERAKLWALLWGEINQLTSLFISLYGALLQLGFADNAYCGLDALVTLDGNKVSRRTDAIIDVETLNALGSNAAAALAINANGRTVTLPRASVTALVAELRITMRDQPWPFFEHTDLLDFPGARSRMITVRRDLEEPRKLAGVFLRGKVAYLFQRYCAEQELTSMLLCIGPSNQEVATLPGSVKEWIDTTHGPDPATRATNQTALFFVLTKFDQEFVEGVGQSDSSAGRWTARLNASLLDFFGRVHDWPHHWHPDEAFNNLFWLRNPGIVAKHILDYATDARPIETGIRSSERARIERVRSEFLENELVTRHFFDPGRSWDEAFRLNDGGVSFLSERLSPVCNPDIKLAQIKARLRNQCAAMHERCARFFVGGDLVQQRTQRMARAEDLIKALSACAKAQRFGKLLASLQLREAELSDIVYRVKLESESVSSSADVDLLGSDRESRYADAIVSFWLERLRALPNTPPMCRYFLLAESSAEHFVSELAVGARRQDLRGALAQRLRDARGVRRRLGESIAKPVLLAAECINSYVTWLGFDPGRPGERPTAGTGTAKREIFAPRPAANGLPALGPQPGRYDLVFAEDWFSAFRKLVDGNSMDQGGQLVDIEQNRRLGVLLGMLEAA